MNSLFKKLPLPIKLGLIGLIPVLFIIYLALAVQYEKNEKLSILEKFRNQILQSGTISMLIDELQSERRLSFGYVLNQRGESAMMLQRNKTDEMAATIKPLPGSRLENYQSFTFYNELRPFRQKIDKQEVNAQEVMNFYTNVIFRLNTLSPVFTADISYLEPVSKDLRGQRALSEMITYLGIIRGTIYLNLYMRQSSRAAADQVSGVWDIYKSYEREFMQKATPEAIASYNKIVTGTELRPTIQYIEQTLSDTTNRLRYDDEAWWNISADGVDKLKELHRNLLEKVAQTAADIYEDEENIRNQNIAYMILIIVLIVVITFYTIKAISDSLVQLKLAAQKIAAGSTGIQIKPETNDVIGSLTNSIIEIDVNNNKLARAAAEIGEGRFDVEVTPRGKDDVLGNSVVKMKNDLQEFARVNEEKLWIQESLTEIANSVRGDKDVSSISQDALNTLMSSIGAEHGMLYVNYGGVLEYKAGYAVHNLGEVRTQLAVGETLIGQAAQNGEMIMIDPAPEDYIRIASSLGDTPPTTILIQPLIHNGIVEGVLEIAAVKRPEPKTIHLLREAATSIAIALQASKSRARLQELLEETQAQSEELQSQHNELENINAELEAQAEKLQASEEELRVQQEELQQANQELEEQTRLLEERNLTIVERNQDIQRKAEELALSTKYKSEFLANMSHELRTPLNSILLLSRLLTENNDKNLTADQIEYARVIQSSGQGLLSLIDEILDLSKIEAGKMQLEYEHVAVSEITGEMQALFEPVAAEKNLKLYIEASAEAPEFMETDKLRVGQVLKNLLSNAIKFTSEGSVTLKVDQCPTDASLVCFSVTDTGIGIPEDKQQLIFEAFQQADGSTRRRFGGTGLGLSISREIVKLLGGRIELKSEAGKGSTFTIYIPKDKTQRIEEDSASGVAEQQPVQQQDPAENAASTDKYVSAVIPESIPDDRNSITPEDKSILIVEDDTAFARSLLDYTRKKGYKGIVTVRGDEALPLARRFAPKGILLDIQLPVKSGFEVMEELKKEPQTRGIPVHIMSSHHAKKESLQKGAIDFINKPMAFEQMQQIFRKLEEVLSKDAKKVLIVEENSKHASALSYFLETFHVNTEIKTSIADSVSALKGDADCVILDMGIPDQQAYAMLEEVKNKEGLENLPIIIFTGKSLSRAEEQRIRQYADSIVVKTAHSYQRILDEVSIFLHLVDVPEAKKSGGDYKKLGSLTDVLKNKTVLIVDDDVRNIFSLTKALEKMQMQVITAVDGKEALQKLKEHGKVDMVLLDMMMPEMDGYETARRIRANFAWRDLPVIAVTAKAMTGDREKCIAAGASDYITKPVDIDQLLSLLRVWLYEGGK